MLYAATQDKHTNQPIIFRLTNNLDLNIRNYSHVSLPYAPDNPHYGINGDYLYASHPDNTCIYGAYSRAEANFLERFYQAGLLQHQYRQLTYNPDFEYMAGEIEKFIIK